MNLALLTRSILSKVTIFTKAIMHVVYPPQFSITIESNFSLVLQSSQEKLKTKVMKNLGVNKVHYGLGEKSEV